MPDDSAQPFLSRILRARAATQASGLDALIVTHLPNVRYLTGLTATAGVLAITASRALLIVDFRYATAAGDVIAMAGDATVELELVDRSYDETVVAVVQRLAAQRIGIEATSMPVSRFNRLSAALAALPLTRVGGCPVLVPTERMIERHRVIKDAGEIGLLREAGRRLSVVARTVPRLIQPGRSEQEIAWDIEAALRREGFERPAFDTIVASGPNGARPHARPGPRRLQPGEGVVLDFGGVYDGYCVDLTRTLQVGAPDPAFRRIFDAVVEAHAAAVAAVRPGVLPTEIDAAARDALRRHGLADAFGHGTGHGLGLEVHEEPRIAKGLTGQANAPVEAGMVFTIEPGAYVPGVGGVRIEDDVLVVARGCELLTDVPIELSAIS